MAGPKLDSVISHWFTPFADFQTSPLEFYEAVEAATGRKEIPGLLFSRIDYPEGGAHTPNREYLRITRDRLTFDVCAAPFGKSYFSCSCTLIRSIRQKKVSSCLCRWQCFQPCCWVGRMSDLPECYSEGSHPSASTRTILWCCDGSG